MARILGTVGSLAGPRERAPRERYDNVGVAQPCSVYRVFRRALFARGCIVVATGGVRLVRTFPARSFGRTSLGPRGTFPEPGAGVDSTRPRSSVPLAKRPNSNGENFSPRQAHPRTREITWIVSDPKLPDRRNTPDAEASLGADERSFNSLSYSSDAFTSLPRALTVMKEKVTHA